MSKLYIKLHFKQLRCQSLVILRQGNVQIIWEKFRAVNILVLDTFLIDSEKNVGKRAWERELSCTECSYVLIKKIGKYHSERVKWKSSKWSDILGWILPGDILRFADLVITENVMDELSVSSFIPHAYVVFLDSFTVYPSTHSSIYPTIHISIHPYSVFFTFPLRSVLLVHTPVILFYAVCFCFLYISTVHTLHWIGHFNNPICFLLLSLRTIYLLFSSTLLPVSFSLCSSIPTSHPSRLILCHFLFLFLCSWVLFWHVCIPCIFF